MTNLSSDVTTAENKQHRGKFPRRYSWYLLAFSGLLSCLSVALPFFSNLATPLQSHASYIGFALSKGQAPYLDLFTTGGFLFHGLAGLSYYLGGSHWLVLVQFLCFYGAGLYFYKITHYLTNRQDLALVMTSLYYLFQLILGFGGLYAVQFAQPFVLYGFWLLLTYFDGQTKDEQFILYGLTMALALLIDPSTLMFWLLAIMVLSISNIKRNMWQRGFYQNLSMTFGFILVTYLVGYFILNMQMFLPYLKQTVVYNLFHVKQMADAPLWGGILQVLVFVGAGLLPGILFRLRASQGNKSHKNVLTLSLLTVLFYLLRALFSQSLYFVDLLQLLPFALFLSSINLFHQGKVDVVAPEEGLSRTNNRLDSEGFFKAYLKSSAYLPLLLLVLGLARPIVTYMGEIEAYQDRQRASLYLKQETSQDDAIYVWDTTDKVYLASQRLSASQFPSPFLFTANRANRQLLLDELMQGRARYILVNHALPLDDEVTKELEENYSEVKRVNLSGFSLYQLVD